MNTSAKSDAYLYILLITVIVSFLYEFMNSPSTACSMFLKIENIVCSFTLIIMLIWSTYRLMFMQSANPSEKNIQTGDYFLLSLFAVPIIITLVEIIRCVICDIQSNIYKPSKNNIVKGAATV